MTYESNMFDLIIDKSTMDALLCGDDAFINLSLMLKECWRVLKVGSVYLGISYGSPENRRLHYQSPHLSFKQSIIEIPPHKKENSVSQSILTFKQTHYVYVNIKNPDADAVCE